MDMTLDFNKELFPLTENQTIAVALASSLSRHVGPVASAEGAEADDKDRDVWRPDGKGKEGLQDDYDYVMYGKVRFTLERIILRDANTLSGLQVRWGNIRDSVSLRAKSPFFSELTLAVQDCICIVRWFAAIPDWIVSPYDQRCIGGPNLHPA